MQCVGAVRPHSTMGKTKLFPDMMLMCLGGGEKHKEKEKTKGTKNRQEGEGDQSEERKRNWSEDMQKESAPFLVL